MIKIIIITKTIVTRIEWWVYVNEFDFIFKFAF